MSPDNTDAYLIAIIMVVVIFGGLLFAMLRYPDKVKRLLYGGEEKQKRDIEDIGKLFEFGFEAKKAVRAYKRELEAEDAKPTPTEVADFIPEQARFEHTWILAHSGAGKTNLIKYLIDQDLKKRCTVVVIDSQGKLINELLSLYGDQGNLVLIEPDPEHPPALNLFDMGSMEGSARDRERLKNSAIDLITYVLQSLGQGAEFTPKQTALFRYTIRLCMEIPNATIQTFADILRDGVEPYARYLDGLEQPVKDYFTTQFSNDKQNKETREQVAWRISLMMEDTTFAKMFSAPKSRINLFDELNSGKLILINTDIDLLGQERTALFGRFFIALLLQASQRRTNITSPIPVFAYVDEAHDYIATDSKIANILDQARKARLGMILANQRTVQIKDPNVLDALMNCAIKFVSMTGDADPHKLARPMGTEPEKLINLNKGTFALTVRGSIQNAVHVNVPLMPERTRDLSSLRRALHRRYAVEPRPQTPKPSPDDDDEPTDRL
jgi:DNA helicase HerA-like ATPase